MSFLGRVHSRFIFRRRVRALGELLARLVPESARSVLDIGCGNAEVSRALMEKRPELEVRGLDVLVRPESAINVEEFDGKTLPLEDQSVDVVLLVDVLHHTVDPLVLLHEARRVARQAIVIKDHCQAGFLAGPTLRFMDWVGNAPHGVALPYNYWSEERWRAAFEELGLTVDAWTDRVPLYPWPASLVFERKLHFVARLVTGISGQRSAGSRPRASSRGARGLHRGGVKHE